MKLEQSSGTLVSWCKTHSHSCSLSTKNNCRKTITISIFEKNRVYVSLLTYFYVFVWFSNFDKWTIPLQLFTGENMEVLMKEALEDTLLQIVVLMIVEEIAKRRPEKLTPFIQQLTTPHLWNPNCSYTISNMLQYYAVRQEVRAE